MIRASTAWLRSLAGLVLCVAPACSEHSPHLVEAGVCEPQQVESFYIARPEVRDVDVLLVIDDSASMGEEQATLAANVARFVQVLERPEVRANFRIGIVSTNHGNPWCPGSTPERGALQLRSCRSHLEDFVGQGDGSVSLDATEVCTAACPEAWAELETLPTTTAEDDVPRPRPWIESMAGISNLPAGLSTVQAIECAGPQGIGGCEFESPLEAMWQAVQRSYDPADPSYGFIREHAVLLVLFVTDEEDCSYSPAGESIFSPEGNRVFWSDPDAPAPTSAVCWNAAVACTPTEENRYECEAVSRDGDGNIVADEDAEALAVLHPLSRYVDVLQEVEDQKREIFEDQEVLVSVVGGVNIDGSVTYADALRDPEFQASFGLGPGCEGPIGRAMPPVRLRALVEAFQYGEERNMFSICQEDYTPALAPLAESLAIQPLPPCVPACVADMDPSTPDVLDPSCTLVQVAPQEYGAFEDVEIPPCEPGEVMPDGHDACYMTRTGDAMDEYCYDSGYNLEYVILRREHVYIPPGTTVRVDCALSGCPAVDCPELRP